MTSRNQLEKAKTLADIRRVCRAMPLTVSQMESFFVETDSARDPNQNARKRISETLEVTPDARILLYGHRGCGKSTELNKLLSEIEDRFIPVSFSIMDEMQIVAARAEDLVLVITYRILKTAQEHGMPLKDKLLQPVLDFFSETVLSETECRDGTFKGGGGFSTESGLLGKLAGLLFQITSEIKYNAHSEETSTAKLRKRPADLLAQANLVIEAVRSGLPENKRLLVVVEDMDKLDLKQARDMFVRNTNLLTGIRTDIIYTIPIFLFHSPEVNAFKHHFDDTVNLPMIKVMEPPEKITAGFEIVRKIVLSRIREELIEAEALDLLIRKTGGVLRHVFDVLHEAAVMTTAKVPLTREHIQYGLNQLRRELSLQIALPFDPLPGGPESVEQLYERLAQCSQKQQNGEKPGLISDSINQILIKSCAMVEYNGERWIGVHPLISDYLKVLGRL